LPRLSDFFSCPEFPFFWCLYFLDFPFFGCLFLAQTFLFFFLPRVSLFFVICFLEFLLFVVVYFLPRLSDFDFYVHKEADERPSPFLLLFFLRLLLSKQTDERPSVRGTQAASGAARHVADRKGRLSQSFRSGRAHAALNCWAVAADRRSTGAHALRACGARCTRRT